MSGDTAALIMGLASLAVFILSGQHIRRMRKNAREELIRHFTEGGGCDD